MGTDMLLDLEREHEGGDYRQSRPDDIQQVCVFLSPALASQCGG